LIVRDIFGVIDPKDRDYFRSSRETWLSMTLEQVQAGREERLAAFREMLMPDSSGVAAARLVGRAGAQLCRSYRGGNADVAALFQQVSSAG
jgi:hypothetical protein